MPNTIMMESPLHYFQSSFSKVPGTAELLNADAECGLVVKEAPLAAHLIIRGAATDKNFCAAMGEATGLMLPLTPCTYHRRENVSIYWLGPNEWLLIQIAGNSAEIEARLRSAFKGHVAIVDVTGGQTSVNLRGEAVATVLKKSSVYDFAAWDNALTGSGQVVQTTFAKASAVVSNKSDGSYDLVIRRSFADYIAQWILDAGEEFGCRIERG